MSHTHTTTADSTTATINPKHLNLLPEAANATICYSEGITAKWTWIGTKFKNQVYDLILTFPKPDPSTSTTGVSLVNIGLQGSHNDLQLSNIKNAIFGEQSSESGPSNEHIKWESSSSSALGIPPAGIDRSGSIPYLKDDAIMFIKRENPDVTTVTMRVHTYNKSIVTERPHSHPFSSKLTAHSNVPPPFPPGSSESGNS